MLQNVKYCVDSHIGMLPLSWHHFYISKATTKNIPADISFNIYLNSSNKYDISTSKSATLIHRKANRLNALTTTLSAYQEHVGQ